MATSMTHFYIVISYTMPAVRKKIRRVAEMMRNPDRKALGYQKTINGAIDITRFNH